MTATTSILVTGGAGYIGGQAVLALLDAGRDVVILDDLSRNNADTIAKEAIFYQGRVHDTALVSEIIKRHNITDIMHFAAFIQVGESVADPLLYYANNVDGTRALLEAAVQTNINNFIFSSTAAVYGDVSGDPVDETAPISPINPYGQSKAICEAMIMDTCNASNMKYGILRYFNVAGADVNSRHGPRGKNVTHLIGRSIEVALGKAEGLTIFGDDFPTRDGTGVRDYIHVVDLVDAHLLLLDKLQHGLDSSLYNLGYGTGATVQEVVTGLSGILGRDIAHTVGPRRVGDPAQVIADPTKIKNALGWQANYNNLDVILRHALAWAETIS